MMFMSRTCTTNIDRAKLRTLRYQLYLVPGSRLCQGGYAVLLRPRVEIQRFGGERKGPINVRHKVGGYVTGPGSGGLWLLDSSGGKVVTFQAIEFL